MFNNVHHAETVTLKGKETTNLKKIVNKIQYLIKSIIEIAGCSQKYRDVHTEMDIQLNDHIPYELGLEDTVVGVMLQIQLGTSIVPAGFSHIP